VGLDIVLKKEADMAIHGSQGILNGQRQPKPRHDYAVPRYRVTLVRANRAAPPSSPLNTSLAATTVLRPLFAGLDREEFLVCGLDAKHGIIGVNVVSIGSLTLAIVHPREVFKPLILMNAAAWICAHNHPSGGDPTPSQEDRVLTSRLRQGAELLGISLLDHLILTDAHCYSFADQGWPGT
jgi:DNA repair protein RadC